MIEVSEFNFIQKIEEIHISGHLFSYYSLYLECFDFILFRMLIQNNEAKSFVDEFGFLLSWIFGSFHILKESSQNILLLIFPLLLVLHLFEFGENSPGDNNQSLNELGQLENPSLFTENTPRFHGVIEEIAWMWIQTFSEDVENIPGANNFGVNLEILQESE